MKAVGIALAMILSLAPAIGRAARLEVGQATVGKPTEIRWSLSDQERGNPGASRLSLSITHLENGTRIFFLTDIPTDGNFSISFQFTDGADHRITAVAQVEGENPVTLEKIVSVTAIEPPKRAILPVLILFLAVIALGLWVGRISRR